MLYEVITSLAPHGFQAPSRPLQPPMLEKRQQHGKAAEQQRDDRPGAGSGEVGQRHGAEVPPRAERAFRQRT